MQFGWQFSQVFGDPFGSEDLLDGDIVTAVEFDQEGSTLAVGDKAGRVWLYALKPDQDRHNFQYYYQFQSHEPEFDYLKSLEIEEKINMIKFVKKQSDSTFLFSTNGKTASLQLSALSLYNRQDDQAVENTRQDTHERIKSQHGQQSAGQTKRTKDTQTHFTRKNDFSLMQKSIF
jgi:serine/threonine-protein phosphatase 2A regulatory subunit B